MCLNLDALNFYIIMSSFNDDFYLFDDQKTSFNDNYNEAFVSSTQFNSNALSEFTESSSKSIVKSSSNQLIMSVDK